jgi:cytosine/uracil/thiamine/allantoin permease
MFDYLTMFLVTILLFAGIGILLTPFLKLMFGKDVWKKISTWTKKTVTTTLKRAILFMAKSIILLLKWLDEALYQLLHRLIYKTPAPPHH